MVVRIEAHGECPVCGQPRIRRSGRQLETCGSTRCATELRARAVRGNVYGNRGGGPKASETASYRAVHARARRALRGKPCAKADETCRGRIEAALKPSVDPASLRTSPDGRFFYPGLPVQGGYRLLCRSHHAREGAFEAASRRQAERILQAFALATTDPDIPPETADRVRRAFGRELARLLEANNG